MAGDGIAYAAHRQAQQQLLEAAEAVVAWLYDRRAHMPEELLDHREAKHRKALREAIRQVRDDERQIAPDAQDFGTEAEYELAVAIYEEEVRLGRTMSQRQREGFACGYQRAQ